jgi:hypothetical protein
MGAGLFLTVFALVSVVTGQLTKCKMADDACNVGEVDQCCERHVCKEIDLGGFMEPDMLEAPAKCERVGPKPTHREYLAQLRAFYQSNAPPKADDEEALIFTLSQWVDREELM